MITARKHPLLNTLIYQAVIKGGLRGSFSRINIRHLGDKPKTNAEPVIVYANHSSWWDGHLAMFLNEECWGLDGYVMMEEKQLARYRFFTRVGAFSIHRQEPRSAMRTLDYAAQLMSAQPGRVLLLFPQGEILANDTRPLRFFNGTSHLVKRIVEQTGACTLCPVALRYEFIGEQKPEAFISVGLPHKVTVADLQPKTLTPILENNLTDLLNHLRDDVVSYTFSAFQTHMQGSWSINRLWDAFRGRSQIAQVGHGSRSGDQA